VIGYAGAFIPLSFNIPQIPQTPICMIHGLDDEVLDINMMRKSIKMLQAYNKNISVHEIPNLAHSIDSRCIEITLNFIKKHDLIQ